jgi:hypothetical protein
MGTFYSVIPHNTGAPFAAVEVSTTTSAKTLLQVGVPSTTAIRLVGWGVSFDGVTATDPPGVCELLDCTSSSAATVTSFTPDLWDNPQAQASLCVGGTTATGYNASNEGTLTAARLLDCQEVHPQTGYSVWYPTERGPSVTISRQVRIRVTFSVSINAMPWIVWEEPN